MDSHATHRPPQSQIVDSLTGIVSFFTEVEYQRSDPSIFVALAESGDLAGYGIPGGSRRVTGSGAGLVYDDAFWAAVGEVVERYCLQTVHPEDLVVASWRELRERGEEAIAPQRWALFDPIQHESGQVTLPPFGEDTRVAWLKAQSLTRRLDCYVPACLVCFFMSRLEGTKVLSPTFSTGAACAQTVPKAILKGICEVVERDAFTIIWRNQLSCARVEIDPKSAIYNVVQERFLRPGLEYTLVQTTLDLPIPSFFGILRNLRHDPPRILVGGACDPDPNRAALKTLLELAQSIQWTNHLGDQTFSAEKGFANVRTFEDRMRLYAYGNHPEAFRFLLEQPKVVKLSSIPSADLGEDSANVGRCCDALAKRNIELIALDVTSADAADAGLSVIKVLSPECQPMEADHRMPFLGGKRWREVPVQLGFRAAPPSIETVNAYPHPYP